MATITEEFVSFETAKLLKEKGFNEECFALYNPDGILIQSGIRLNNSQVGRVKGSYSAPTLQMTMKWFLKKYNIFICVLFLEESNGFGYTIENTITKKYIATSKNSSYKEPEEACEAAIKYYLERKFNLNNDGIYKK